MSVSKTRDILVRVDINGEIWKLYSVEFEHNERLYSFYIHARSPEHAEEIVRDIHASARVAYEVLAFADEPPTEINFAVAELLHDPVVH
ncbi:hypothetical protein GSO32_004222 [Salmonella enterica]|nr:hypothetical protein [Salmonella enterica]ECZ0089401.1 hypothetical protein [Salmonella enterica subsp. enterica serovar Miami]EDS6071580.1 hypothetical protein [Salmonella enterica subsp. enterica serovar Pomona]EHE7865430.1 hypothetical protein [Salmonella enterica subsp. enterica serovar Abony]EEJ8361072.1 hypothetical protein [Salmonella enterica]